MSNWYEKEGDIPPPMTVCQAWDWEHNKWVDGIFLMKGNSDHAFASGNSDSWDKLFWAYKFRPIKSERQKAVDAAVTVMQETHRNATFTDMAEALYKAGLLRIKPDA